MADNLRISMVQSHIIWEDRDENLGYYGELLRRVSGKTDIAVLPETFTTGFSMDVEKLADTMDGPTIPIIKGWAKKYKLAVAGSFIAKEGGKYFNRAFFVTPEGETYLYDKRHLFRMAGEDQHFTAGDKRTIVRYKDWNICLQVCYDLRFPVWSRNVDNEYDLLIYVANWPEARKKVWKTLLQARAMENMAYVCGVNRVGIDGKGFVYRGDSMIFSPKGKKLADAGVIEIGAGKGRAITLTHPAAPSVPEPEEPADRVPIVGNVAAGSPILAQECIEDYLTFHTGHPGDVHFALRVRGESMLNAGILPGDLVVVRQQQTCNQGEIVVAMIDDEATVKRFSRKNGHIWLLPENDDYEPIDGTYAQILGKVVAVVRQY